MSRKRVSELEETNKRLLAELEKRKHLENLLRESRERYKAVVDDQIDLVCRFSPQMILTFANDAYCRYFNQSRESLIGTDFRVSIPEEFHSHLRTFFASFTPRDPVRVLEHQVVTPGNVIRWQQWTNRAFFDNHGKITEFQAVGRDITEQKIARNELENRMEEQNARITRTQETLNQEMEERIRTEEALTHRQQALEAIYAMVTAFDAQTESLYDQLVLSVSDILKTPLTLVYELKGYRIASMAELADGRLSHKKLTELPCPVCAKLIKEGKAFQIRAGLMQRYPDGLCYRNNGLKSYIGVPVIDKSGEILGCICAFDRIERTFNEYEVHLMYIFARYLAHEIARRRLEIQLRQSQEMKMLGDLTSGVAHEVRNPLNGIIATVEALFQDIGQNTEYEPYLKHIRKQVSRLSLLMEDLLALGRPVKEEHKTDVQLISLVSEAFAPWKQALPESGVHMQLRIAEAAGKAKIRADVARFDQVFVNLLENALQHSPPSGDISLVVLPPENDRVRIQVIDKGCGIPFENASRVFEPFFTTRKSGTGLGLSIVKHIVESHGGAINVINNDPPPGLTVEINLPLSKLF